MVKSSATHSVASDVLFAPRSPVVVDWNASSVAVFELFQIALAADHWQRRCIPHLLLNSLQTAKHTHTHTHTHWILLKQETMSGSGISWDIGPMQVCNSFQTDNHASTPPPLCFLQAGCPSCRPTNSVKALKAFLQTTQVTRIFHSNSPN